MPIERLFRSARPLIIASEMAATAQVQVAQPSPLRSAGHRFLEASPGLVTWVMLFSPAWIPIVFGTGGAIVVGVGVLAFDLYWLFRAYSIITGIYQTYRRVKRGIKQPKAR